MRSLRRRMRVSGVPLAFLGVLALAAALLVTAAPRYANHVADRALRADVGRLPYSARDLVVTRTPAGELRPAGEGDLDAYQRRLPAPLPGLIGERWFAAVIGPEDVTTRVGDGPLTQVALRAQSGAREAARVIEGRWPANRGDPNRVEVAVSPAVARTLGVSVNGVVALNGMSSARVVVVGVFEPVDRSAPVWDELGVALEPFPGLPPDVPPQVMAVTDGNGVAAARRLAEPVYSWRYRIDERRLAGDQVDAVATALAEAKRRPPADGLAVNTSLDATLSRFVGQLRAVRGLLAIVQAGLLATLLGLVLLVASLAAERRRAEFALLRARGAAVATIGGRTLAEALTVVPAAVLIGWFAGRFAPGRPSGAQWLTVAVALVATLALPVFAAAGQRRLAFVQRRRDLVRHRPSPRRLTAELVVILLAALGGYLLRERGIAPDDGVDPYLSSVPVLLAVAAALVALRVFPWPLRQVSRLAARSRGAVAFLGLARAGRAGPVTAGPLAVLVIAITTGIFSGAVVTAVDDARDRAANQSVPGDARLSGYVFAAGTEQRLATQPGVSAVAPAAVAAGTTVRFGGASRQGQAFVVDGPKLAEVLARSGVEGRLPAVLVDARRGDGPLPAAVSPEMAAGVGTRGTVEVRSRSYDFVVAAVVETLPGVEPAISRFVALPWQALPESATPLLANHFYVSGSNMDPAALAGVGDQGQREYAATVRMVPPATTVTTWTGYRDALDRTGANELLSFAFLTGTVGATALAMLAVGFTVLAGAAQRGQVLAWLRTMGLSGRQGRGLLGYELVPLAGIAVLAGGLVGTLLPTMLGPALDLSTFTSGTAVRTYLDPLVAGAVLALVLLALTAAVLVDGFIKRKPEEEFL